MYFIVSFGVKTLCRDRYAMLCTTRVCLENISAKMINYLYQLSLERSFKTGCLVLVCMPHGFYEL